MKNFNYIVFVAFILMVIFPSFDIFAQCTGPLTGIPNDCCPPGSNAALCAAFNCPPCAPVPLDGGLSALLIAGVAYGAKRIYGKSKS